MYLPTYTMTTQYYNYFHFREFTLTYCADDCSLLLFSSLCLFLFVCLFFWNLSIFCVQSNVSRWSARFTNHYFVWSTWLLLLLWKSNSNAACVSFCFNHDILQKRGCRVVMQQLQIAVFRIKMYFTITVPLPSWADCWPEPGAPC